MTAERYDRLVQIPDESVRRSPLTTAEIKTLLEQPIRHDPFDRLLEAPKLHQDWQYSTLSDSHAIVRGLSTGTVIRWFNGRYLYAALKTPVGWFTTATEANTMCPQKLSDTELGNVLSDVEFAVATAWERAHVSPF